MPLILPLRERAAVRDRWLQRRLDEIVPELMRREGIDMWVIIAREYNEDPVIKTMLPATWLNARRRTILLFHDPGEDGEVERLAVARYDVGELFEGAWDKQTNPNQWARLAELIAERDPERIGIDVSSEFALADGLARSEYEALVAALPEALRGRLVSAERLAIGWLERRLPEEVTVFRSITRIAHRIIAEGLSASVIQPGVTTTADVQWWYRERIRELKLTTWFHPDVSVQRKLDEGHSGSFASHQADTPILPGDLIHIDFGISYLGLNTDTQQHAYVLESGESAAPQGLTQGMGVCNRLQDILTGNFRAGRTGNEVLAATLEQAADEGIQAMIYTHPLGNHGHGAGPTIGLWDQQSGVPGRGDYPLFLDTAYSIELNVEIAVPEWNGKRVRIMLEEDAFFSAGGVDYLDGRQTELILIP